MKMTSGDSSATRRGGTPSRWRASASTSHSAARMVANGMSRHPTRPMKLSRLFVTSRVPESRLRHALPRRGVHGYAQQH